MLRVQSRSRVGTPCLVPEWNSFIQGRASDTFSKDRALEAERVPLTPRVLVRIRTVLSGNAHKKYIKCTHTATWKNQWQLEFMLMAGVFGFEYFACKVYLRTKAYALGVSVVCACRYMYRYSRRCSEVDWGCMYLYSQEDIVKPRVQGHGLRHSIPNSPIPQFPPSSPPTPPRAKFHT